MAATIVSLRECRAKPRRCLASFRSPLAARSAYRVGRIGASPQCRSEGSIGEARAPVERRCGRLSPLEATENRVQVGCEIAVWSSVPSAICRSAVAEAEVRYRIFCRIKAVLRRTPGLGGQKGPWPLPEPRPGTDGFGRQPSLSNLLLLFTPSPCR
jgi:hypothetical protein